MQAKIVVPLDESALAETVLPHALLMARLTHSSLVLLRAVDPGVLVDPVTGVMLAGVTTEQTWNDQLDDAATYLKARAEVIRRDGFVVETTVVATDPAKAIITLAHDDPAVRMIAMSTHGRAGVGRWLLGSVAEKILQGATVPVLLVRPTGAEGHLAPPPALPYTTILVPLDGSALAEQALAEAQSLATTRRASLLLVSVQPEHGSQDPNAPESAAVQTYLAQVAQRLESAGVRAELRIAHGQPAEGILHAAAQAGAELIVMATHGRGGIQRMWLGSVAMKVVQGATEPVLLVRAK